MNSNENNRGIGYADKSSQKNRPNGNNHCLFIAIDGYVEPCPPLHNCVHDAKTIRDILVGKYYEKPVITELYNAQATQGNIHNALEKLIGEVTPKDTFFLFFAGHGVFRTISKKGYWLPVEAEIDKLNTYLSHSDIKDYLDQINSLHTFVVIDSCFSGTFFQTGTQRIAGIRQETQQSRWGLTSGWNEVVPDGERGKHSPFTKHVIDILERTQQPFSILDFGQAVLEKVQANEKQTPQFGVLNIQNHDNGIFYFYPKSNEESAWQASLAQNTEGVYQSYLDAFPNGQYAVQARTHIHALHEDNAWQQAEKTNTDTAYYDFTQDFPNGKYAKEAYKRMENLEEDRFWKKATGRDSLIGYDEYLRNSTLKKYSQEAQNRIQTIRKGDENNVIDRQKVAKKSVQPPIVVPPPSKEVIKLKTEKKEKISVPNIIPKHKADLTPEEWYDKGFNEKDYNKKIQYYSQAIVLNPKFALAYLNLGEARDSLKQYEKAKKDYDKAIELNPKLADAYYNRGIVNKKLGQYNEAIKDYDKAIELNPKDASAYNNRGNNKNALRQYLEAIKDFNKAIELSPNYTLAYNNRGTSKYDLGQYAEALKDYEKAIALNPDFTMAIDNRKLAMDKLK